MSPGPTSLKSTLQGLRVNIPLWIGDIGAKISEYLSDPITEELGELASYIAAADESVGGGEPGFAEIIRAYFDGDTETMGTLQYYLGLGLNAFSEFRLDTEEVFVGFKESLVEIFVKPAITVMNTVIDGMNKFIDGANSITRELTTVGVGPLRVNVIEALGGTVPTFSPIDKIPIPGAQYGGIFSSGLLEVGERGPEFILPAQQIAVLPNEIRNALISLDRVLAQPQPQYVYGAGGDTIDNRQENNFDYSMRNQFTVRDNQDLMQRLKINQIPSNFRR